MCTTQTHQVHKLADAGQGAFRLVGDGDGAKLEEVERAETGSDGKEGEGGEEEDGEQTEARSLLLPLLIPVQQFVRSFAAKQLGGGAGEELLLRCIDQVVPQQHRPCVKQAYVMRRLAICIDGLDEAGAYRDEITSLIIELQQEGHTLVVTSRPGGVDAVLLKPPFVLVELLPLASEQQAELVQAQLAETPFFTHLIACSEIRTRHDAIYEAAFPDKLGRRQVEAIRAADRFRKKGAFDPEMRQTLRRNAIRWQDGAPQSDMLRMVDEEFTMERTWNGASPGSVVWFLDRKMGEELKNKRADLRHAAEEEAATSEAFALSDVELGRAVDNTVHSLDLPSKAVIEAWRAKYGGLLLKLAQLVFRRSGGKSPDLGGEGARALWSRIVARTDELYIDAEKLLPVAQTLVEALCTSAGIDVGAGAPA